MPPPPYSLHIPLPVAAPMLAVADAATAAVLARCRLCTTARAPRSHFFLVPTLRRGAVAKRSKKFEKVYTLRVEGGGLALCPVGCGALVVSCPRRVGSDTSSGCLAQHRGPFSSRSTTRSKGEKRREKNIILKCGPWRKTRDKEKYNVAEIITVLEIEEQ